MKKIIFAIFIALLLGGCKQKSKETSSSVPLPPETGIPAESNGYIVRVGDMAPDFTVKLTDGNHFTLSENRGKTVMLQFTASWCGVCRKEMPFIEKDIWKKHRNNPDFMLLAVDREEPLEKILPFIESTGITYPVALDPEGAVFQLYAEKSAGITRNILIGENGRIIMLTRLFNEEEFKNLVGKIDEILASDQKDKNESSDRQI